MDHYAIGASKAGGRTNPFGVLLGDGLVGQHSAAGRTLTLLSTVPIPHDNFRLYPKLSHLDIARHTDVYRQLRQWILGSSLDPVPAELLDSMEDRLY